jgi:AraC-like DNA-binding protein/quercetin dioxygenase-like cupin family protein
MLLREESQALPASFPLKVSEVEIGPSASKEEYHWHDCIEITCIGSGKARYYVNGRVYAMHPGDVIIFNDGEPHAWEAIGKAPVRASVLIFAPAFVSEKRELFDSEYLSPFTAHGERFQNRLPYDDERTRAIADLVAEAGTEYAERSPGYELMIKAIVLRLLTLLVRYHRSAEPDGRRREERRRDLRRICAAVDYIGGHYAEPLALEHVARVVSMSPNYFSAYFKEALGRSFVEYLTALRVEAARELLSTTNRKVLDIAFDCGFNTASNFYRAFRRVTGRVPAALRHIA